VLTEKVKGLTGGYFIVDLDPESAADKLLAAIDERRAGLGLPLPGVSQTIGAR
jgi:carbon-monoxide dehydrogenase catalytic subunit